MTFHELPQALLRTIIDQIAVLLMAGADGDVHAARRAAAETLCSYDPQSEMEVRYAARIITFSLQAGEALAQAAHPDMPLTRVLRLRTGAVSLAREAEKTERRLEKLRENRARGLPEEPQPEPVSPRVARTQDLMEDNQNVSAYAAARGITWSEALKQRRREQRLIERQRREANAAPVAPAPAFA